MAAAAEDNNAVIRKTHFSDAQKTDVNELTDAMLKNPETLSPALTFLGGKMSDKFPLTMLTEGVQNTRSEEIEGLSYQYNIFTRLDRTRALAESPTSTVDLGKGGQPFKLVFPDRWFVKDYVLVSQSGVQARIMKEPRPKGNNWEYTLQLVSPDQNQTMPSEDVKPGSEFAVMFAPVGVDFSRGNAMNWEAPGKVEHKLTTIRKSYEISGNANDYVVDIQLPTRGGGTSRYWMDFQEWQRYLQWKQEYESLLWYGQQSYNQSGNTHLTDERNQPVIIGPGVLQQIPNKETYSILTPEKLHNVVGDVFFNMTDGDNKQVTLFTGTGGKREFDAAMKKELNSQSYTVIDNGRFLNGSGRNITLTGYFTTYEHIDGHTVNVVKVPMFDHGPLAQASQDHPVSGLPLESYRMVFLDMTNYQGTPNVQMVNKSGRELVRWAVPGSVIPRGFEGNATRATDLDGASVHYLKTCGICLKRFDTSIDLQCVRQ